MLIKKPGTNRVLTLTGVPINVRTSGGDVSHFDPPFRQGPVFRQIILQQLAFSPSPSPPAPFLPFLTGAEPLAGRRSPAGFSAVQGMVHFPSVVACR